MQRTLSYALKIVDCFTSIVKQLNGEAGPDVEEQVARRQAHRRGKTYNPTLGAGGHGCYVLMEHCRCFGS